MNDENKDLLKLIIYEINEQVCIMKTRPYSTSIQNAFEELSERLKEYIPNDK